VTVQRFGVVYLDANDTMQKAQAWRDISGIVAWDREADDLGAPQNVQKLYELLSLKLPIWYGGGLETVHTAELVLGLGCEKVIVDKGFYKTERSPEHFVNKLGEACVPVVRDDQSIETAVRAGAAFAYCHSAQAARAASQKLRVLLEGGGSENAWGVAALP